MVYICQQVYKTMEAVDINYPNLFAFVIVVAAGCSDNFICYLAYSCQLNKFGSLNLFTCQLFQPCQSVFFGFWIYLFDWCFKSLLRIFRLYHGSERNGRGKACRQSTKEPHALTCLPIDERPLNQCGSSM